MPHDVTSDVYTPRSSKFEDLVFLGILQLTGSFGLSSQLGEGAEEADWDQRFRRGSQAASALVNERSTWAATTAASGFPCGIPIPCFVKVGMAFPDCYGPEAAFRNPFARSGINTYHPTRNTDTLWPNTAISGEASEALSIPLEHHRATEDMGANITTGTPEMRLK